MGPIHPEEHGQVGGRPETSCPIRAEPGSTSSTRMLAMAVSGTAQEDLTPRGDVKNLQWTSPVPHHQYQFSPPTPPPPIPRQSRTHCQQFSFITTRTPYRGDFLLPRIIRDWNSLSKDAVEATTVDSFVSRASH